MNRRTFLGSAVAAAAATTVCGQAENGPPEWPGPVIDTHHHLRQDIDANVAHINGCGVGKAVLLTPVQQVARAKEVMAKYPGRFWLSVSADVTKPDAEQLLTAAVKDGAIGIGELKYHVAADGPELRRMYALAGELHVPIMVHFQEVPHYQGEGTYATGWKRFEAILKEFRQTTFIAHADAVWANVSTDYKDDVAYPTGPIKMTGITDQWMADYANLFGDLSANSANNALSRSPEFTSGFLATHQDKLLFGSDCSCVDGTGKGNPPPNDPARATPNGVGARLSGKCVARDTLGIIQRSARPAVFRKIAGENAVKVLKLG